jgi:hypothetical protein
MPFTAKVPPSGSDWLHEIKHDGYRVQLRRDGARVTLYTKNGYDWTDRFRRIVAAAREVECGDFVIDGEAVTVDKEGVAVFNRLRRQDRRCPQCSGRVYPNAPASKSHGHGEHQADNQQGTLGRDVGRSREPLLAS